MLRRLTLWHLSAAGTVDYDEEKSHLPGLHDANNWTRTSQRVLQLRKILHEWTKFLTPRSILGYSVETPNPQSVYPSAPTLVPTSMAHQNYPYLATRLQAPVSDLYGPNRDIANNNMFLYLEMTGNKPLPTVALNSHANWVVNEPGQTPKDGTLAIAKLYFFDRYLLPRLATINRDTALRAINADNDGYDLVQIEFHFELGKLFDKQSDPSLDQWKKRESNCDGQVVGYQRISGLLHQERAPSYPGLEPDPNQGLHQGGQSTKRKLYQWWKVRVSVASDR
ncbi:hypothetical protein FRC08_005745 [Ceratobasidium sp. 394]|nr:hypothetical protein FRC08_005745 [Ceratobasidium sp. 394]